MFIEENFTEIYIFQSLCRLYVNWMFHTSYENPYFAQNTNFIIYENNITPCTYLMQDKYQIL